MDFQLNLASETVVQAHPIEPLVVAPSSSLRDVLELMQARNRGSVMVCSDSKTVIGIFTERDVVKLLARGTDLSTPIEDVMIREPVTVAEDDTVAHAIVAMAKGGYRRLPVVDRAGHPIGELSVSRVLEYMVEHFPKLVYTLPPQPLRTSREREGA